MRLWSLKSANYQPQSAMRHMFVYGTLDNKALAPQICFQAQSLEFLRHLIENLESRDPHRDGTPIPLGLSLRAGLIKTYVAGVASIIEAVLADVGIRRGYTVPKDERSRTFGKVLGAWERAKNADVLPILADLHNIKKYRDYVHLANAASDNNSYWRDILHNEAALFTSCRNALGALEDLADREGAKYRHGDTGHRAPNHAVEGTASR